MLDSFFTIESLLSLQGAAIASLMVPNVLGYLIGAKFDKCRKFFSFAISFVLAFLIAILAKVEWSGFIVAIFNGFLIFASAVGINQMSSKKEKIPEISKSVLMKKTSGKSDKIKALEKPKNKLFRTWF